jgi:hypothetical protein
MRPALDPAGHRVPRTKPTCLLHTWRPHQRRPFALVLHLHQHHSSRNLHLQYLAKNQSTQRCQSLITPGSDHPPVLEPHMVFRCSIVVHMATDRSSMEIQWVLRIGGVRWQANRVEVERLTGGLPVMDRQGRTIRGVHSGQFRMAGG